MVDIISKKNLSLSEVKDIKNIQNYLNLFWKKNHILAVNKKIFLWQHKSLKNKVDFLIKQRQKKIIAILGIINQSRDNIFSECSLAIWHSLDKISGLGLILNVLSNEGCHVIKATTISPKAVKIYKSLGFVINNFNQYYLTHLKKADQIITKNLLCKKKLYSQKLIIFSQLKSNFVKKKIITKKKYYIWRFCNHPKFKYFYLSEKSYKLILICRIDFVNKYKFLKIVDFVGSFKGSDKFIKMLPLFLKKNNFHHLEFLHYGDEDKNIVKSGFQKINNKQIIPLNTNPFKKLEKQNLICGYKKKSFVKFIKIVRADGDADRP